MLGLHSSPDLRGRPSATAPALAAAVIALLGLWTAPRPSAAEGMAGDPFADAIVGEWHGSGEYEGATLTLSRSWTLELHGQFLHADMRVRMANGGSFGALMYWSRESPGVYEVLWMDGLGRRQSLRAVRDAETGVVASLFLDELAGPKPEWRSWEFTPRGEESYEERLYRVTEAGRELLAVFTFERGASGEEGATEPRESREDQEGGLEP